MIPPEQIQTVRKNWQKASELLKFELVSPYVVNVEGEAKEAFAFLPHYGSKNGAIVLLSSFPQFEYDEAIINYCKDNNIFYSIVNFDLFLSYNEADFVEILDDWKI